MSPDYESIKSYFKQGFWLVDQVHDAVVYGMITPYEFAQITGENYQEIKMEGSDQLNV